MIPTTVVKVGAGAAAAAACAVVGLVDPNVGGRYPLCPFRAVTGLWCPGCGSTRALNALLHGDVARAMGYNAVFVVAVPFAVYAYLAWAVPHLPRLRVRAPALWALAALALAFGVARNIPAGPLAALAP